MPKVNLNSLSAGSSYARRSSTVQTKINSPKSYGPQSSFSNKGMGVELFGDWETFEQWLGLGSYRSSAVELDKNFGSGKNAGMGLLGFRTYKYSKHDEILQAALRSASKKAAAFIVEMVKKGIRDGAPGGQSFEKLSDATVALRTGKARERGEKAKSWVGAKGHGYFSGKKPLLRTGDLYRSIEGQSLPNGSFFVGIPTGSKNREGEDLIPIGAGHELGFTMKVTEKVASWYAAQGIPLKGDTDSVVIPARPFLQPVLQKYKSVIYKIYRDEINTYLYNIKGFSKNQKKYFSSKRQGYSKFK